MTAGFRPRKFAPLPEGHQEIGMPCEVCSGPFAVGDTLTLVPLRVVDTNLCEATPIHWRCLPDSLRDERCACTEPGKCVVHG